MYRISRGLAIHERVAVVHVATNLCPREDVAGCPPDLGQRLARVSEDDGTLDVWLLSVPDNADSQIDQARRRCVSEVERGRQLVQAEDSQDATGGDERLKSL